MSSYDDDIDLDFFDEPETQEAPERRRRRGLGGHGDGPRRPPGRVPTGPVALARLGGLVALGIAIVVALVFWVGACQGPSKHDEYSSYMDQVRAVAASSAKVGDEFAAKLASPGLKLADLATSLEQWAQQEQQLYAQAQQIRPPGPLAATHQQVLGTLQLRALGLAGLANALAQTNVKDSATAAGLLADQAQLLTTSDVVWTQLYKLPATQTLKALGVTGVVVPPSQFVANADIVSSRSFQIVYERLRPASTGSATAGPHGTGLVSTDAVGAGKTTTLSTSQPTTVYVSADLVFRVTIQDTGNYQEMNIPVTLTVSVGKTTVVTKQETVPAVQAGQQASVSFGNLQLTPNAFGHQATVAVKVAAVPGEQQTTNNSASYPVFFSLSQG